MWVGLVWMDGMVIIGQRSSKSTFSANNPSMPALTERPEAFFFNKMQISQSWGSDMMYWSFIKRVYHRLIIFCRQYYACASISVAYMVTKHLCTDFNFVFVHDAARLNS